MQKSIQKLKNGDIAAIPTETVYGLAADATNSDAVTKIFALKNRPSFNPLIVHVDSVAMARQYVEWSETAQQLADAFWGETGGPLTLVLPLLQRHPEQNRKAIAAEGSAPSSEERVVDSTDPSARTRSASSAQDDISSLVTSNLPTLAIRMPNHPLARDIITAVGKPLSAPSANPSGRLSPTTAAHVKEYFPNLTMVDGGNCSAGIESTIVMLQGADWQILRHGTITEAAIINTLGSKPSVLNDDTKKPLSPGQLLKHYAPNKPLRLNATSVDTNESLLSFGAHDFKPQTEYRLSSNSSLEEAAQNLYQGLITLDNSSCEKIAVMPIPNTEIGVAINDRLQRAAQK